MKKRNFWLITALMTGALLGVFVMQLYYINEAYQLKSQLFAQEVKQVLHAVANKIQKRNVYFHVNKKDSEARQKRKSELRKLYMDLAEVQGNYKANVQLRKLKRQKEIEAEVVKNDNLIQNSYLRATIISEAEYRSLSAPTAQTGNSPLRIGLVGNIDKDGNLISGGFFPTLGSPDRKSIQYTSDNLPDTIRYLVYHPQTLQPLTISLPKVPDDLRRRFEREDNAARKTYEEALAKFNSDSANTAYNNQAIVEDVVNELQHKNLALADRLPAIEVIDNYLKAELINHNIPLQYNFMVTPDAKDSVVYMKTANNVASFLPANTFHAKVFSNDMTRDPGRLYISFPNKNTLIMTNMWATLASSAALLLVLVFIFSYTLYAILRQKKISEMKTDFINNMTHEFKTPVATIMIASEALRDTEVQEDRNRVNRLAGIIYDENVRLGNHIERVLSIARLEKNELNLERKPVDLNELITAVIDSMQLQLQKKNALVNLSLEASNAVVTGDELHLSNVLYNLVDNANKYSAGAPEISIRTAHAGKNLLVEIADKGIGMTKEQTKRIFDQFYRVPTGNLHDVKGFGLGLNYVQDIVKQMNGTIKVQSEKDKGTGFTILFNTHKNS
ncbi:two-component sensor histidine kinase [Pedobacter yulinensis]|uniref:histidine kinase n=1 Tax=Pedobacter yulinensis TaxID=2126353 RepID=A0A2T3HRU1_9SPHI|nr:HAMP domain-containing sensor histidine kinase [Pedobacter yulinensis]PST85123.1 two-component sensor histidine kinase [Pedobacter yulinensis]